MPAAVATRPPVEINPFDKAISDYNEMRQQLMLTRDELTSTQQALDQSRNETEGVKARMAQEGEFFRTELARTTSERDAFGRTCIELASTINAIGEAAGTVVNLAIRAQEIAKTFKEKFRDAKEVNDAAIDMEIDIRRTLRDAGIPHAERETTPLPDNTI